MADAAAVPSDAALGRRPPFVLASASPRRRDLLVQIAMSPDLTLPSDVDETPLPRELPRDHALRLAAAKAGAAHARMPGAIILAADTVVARGRRILPKPASADEARRCLEMLSGARHRVFGAIAVIDRTGRCVTRLAETHVAFKCLAAEEIAAYIACGEWRDKAGGYAIQGRAAAFVRKIIGSYSNVVGLPLFETAALLTAAGIVAESATGLAADAAP